MRYQEFNQYYGVSDTHIHTHRESTSIVWKDKRKEKRSEIAKNARAFDKNYLPYFFRASSGGLLLDGEVNRITAGEEESCRVLEETENSRERILKTILGLKPPVQRGRLLSFLEVSSSRTCTVARAIRITRRKVGAEGRRMWRGRQGGRRGRFFALVAYWWPLPGALWAPRLPASLILLWACHLVGIIYELGGNCAARLSIMAHWQLRRSRTKRRVAPFSRTFALFPSVSNKRYIFAAKRTQI